MAAYEDRISELPEALLHEIMSKMSIKYAVRTSILSKRWNCIWQTLPFLNFDEEFYLSPGENWEHKTHREKANLLRTAKQIILSRCRRQQPESVTNLQELYWVFPMDIEWKDFNFDLELETLIHNVAKTGLRELSIINSNHHTDREIPNLPSPLILPRSINKLHLSGLGLGGLKSLLPGPGGIVKFGCLRTLNLCQVYVKDEVVNELNLTCPSLEDLEMLLCFGPKNLHLTGFPQLKRLSLDCLWTPKTVKIEFLPQLRILTIQQIGSQCWEVNLNNTLCDSVRHLKLFGNFLTDKLLHGFVYKCRLLEHLSIGYSKAQSLEQVSISMDTIQELSIVSVDKLTEVELRAPMLRQFSFTNTVYNMPPTITWKHSNLPPKVRVSLITHSRRVWARFTPDDDKRDMWRNFFACFNHAKELLLRAPPVFLNWVKRGGSLSHSPICSVEDIVFVKVSFDDHESPSVVQVLESLMFLAPRATSLSIINAIPGIKTTIPDIIFKFVYDGETSSSNQSQLFGVESWLQSVSQVIIQKFNGEEDELKEVNNLFGNRLLPAIPSTSPLSSHLD